MAVQMNIQRTQSLLPDLALLADLRSPDIQGHYGALCPRPEMAALAAGQDQRRPHALEKMAGRRTRLFSAISNSSQFSNSALLVRIASRSQSLASVSRSLTPAGNASTDTMRRLKPICWQAWAASALLPMLSGPQS